MIDHLSTYATDYEKTKKFYAKTLPLLGYPLQGEWNTDGSAPKMCVFGPEGRMIFWIIEKKEAASPRHIAFSAQNRGAVSDFHKAAMEAGGKDNGAPGLRPEYHEDYFGAFAFDPDGNNVEAVCHAPE